MSRSVPALWAVEEVRQLNRLFLGYLRSRPAIAAEDFGLPRRATDLLETSSVEDIERAADFPRALFRLFVPEAVRSGVMDPLALAEVSGRRVLTVALLQSAWNLCRSSGYAARLLLRLTDADVRRLRAVELDEVMRMSEDDRVVRAAFDDLDWIWKDLLTESRPEQRRRLRLIGLQPELEPRPVPGMA